MQPRKHLHITVWALATLILFTGFSKTFIVFSFAANQHYLAANVCENRNKPELMCSGKCVLNKAIPTDAQKENHKLPIKLKDLPESLLFVITTSIAFKAEGKIESLKKEVIFTSDFGVSSYLCKFFHPPRF